MYPNRDDSLALFDKCGVTLWTADLNLALASWYTDLLFAGWTTVNMVCLSLTKQDFLGVEPVTDLICLVQKHLILGRSLIYIAGEHPVICQNQKNPHQ